MVEGILIFAEPELCRRLDIKIFVDTDADVRILRRIVRDTKGAAAAWIPSSRSIWQRSSP